MPASSETISLLPSFREDHPAAWWSGGAVSYAQFLGTVFWLADRLPKAPYVINLCETRYVFLVSFAAAIARLKTNLLPSNRLPEEVRKVAQNFPDCYCLVEKEIPGLGLPQFVCELPDTVSLNGRMPPQIPADHVGAVAFTSGSTGQPKPNPKQWKSLVIGAELWRARFWPEPREQLTIVATVPPQHMYGLETTILLPLACGVSVQGGRPFFPDSIRQILIEIPSPVGLVTTPIHMRACVESNLAWPRVSFLLSATAPLPEELARQAERAFGAPVLEIYGCTEGGSLASRRTLDGDLWHLYDGVRIRQDNGTAWVNGGHLTEPVPLQDRVDIVSDTTFRLGGRSSDIVNIAGKRGSLGDLNHKLSQIAGVKDGVFVMPEEMPGVTTRLAALVVAPGMTEQQVLTSLESLIDPAFLPRPLLLVDALPYNETGKLPRQQLLDWIRQRKTRT